MRIFSHRHENLFSWAREFRLFVTPRSRVGQGVFAYTVNRGNPSRPGQTPFSWLQEVFPIGTKREFLSAGFDFSRLTAAACVLPAGSKVHGPDSSLPTAISRINAMVQAAKRKARGYHTFEGYSAMIYLVAGKLNLATPNPFRHFH